MQSRSFLLMAMVFVAGGVGANSSQRSQPTRTDQGGLLRVNAAYFDLAAQTGGDFYFWAPGEFARAGLQLPLHDEPVLLAYGRLDGPRRSFEFPVESGVRTLTVFAGAQRKNRAVLVRPGGAIVADGAAGVQLQTFSHMTIATIQAPAPGSWRIDFEGAGLFSVSAHLKPSAEASGVSVNDLDFVEWGGRPAHEGWFPIQRELRRGESITCQLEVSGAASAVQVAFVSSDNRSIATVHMDSEPGDSGRYLGRCVIPAVPFRVVVTGRDQMGQVFRRTTSALRTPL